jgi:hypothetical protein
VIFSTKIVEVIEVVTPRGRGVDEDPVRNVTQYYAKDGLFLAERDPADDIVEKQRIEKAMQEAYAEHQKQAKR